MSSLLACYGDAFLTMMEEVYLHFQILIGLTEIGFRHWASIPFQYALYTLRKYSTSYLSAAVSVYVSQKQ